MSRPGCLQRMGGATGTWGRGGKVSEEWVQPCSGLRREMYTWPQLGEEHLLPLLEGRAHPPSSAGTLISWDPHHPLKGLHPVAGFSSPASTGGGLGPQEWKAPGSGLDSIFW